MHDLSVDIVVCVHNALADVEKCLQSLTRMDVDTNVDLRVIVVDDGSDKPTKNFIEGWVTSRKRSVFGPIPNKNQRVLVRKDAAQGYTKACNSALDVSNADIIVFLNSDTVVPSRFLKKLLAKFQTSPWVGAVGPVSNAATFQSVPDLVDGAGKFAINDMIAGKTVDEMDEFCERAAQQNATEVHVPILNGFCLAIRSEVVSKVGKFDEEGFPFGYGEENDYCFRITDAGFRLCVHTGLYVFHAKSKSFGSERRSKLVEDGKRALDAKYSADRQKRASKTLRLNPYLAANRKRMAEIYKSEVGS